jgi:hypothetical protein
VAVELAEMARSMAAEQREAVGGVRWAELLAPSVRRRLCIAVGLQWAQQGSGINSIISFGGLFFRSAGLGGGDSLGGTLSHRR